MGIKFECATSDDQAQAPAGQSPLAELLAQKIVLSKAAQMLDRSVCQLHWLRLNGKLECFRIAGRWYTTEAAISALIHFPDAPGSQSIAYQAPSRRRREKEAADRRAAALLG